MRYEHVCCTFCIYPAGLAKWFKPQFETPWWNKEYECKAISRVQWIQCSLQLFCRYKRGMSVPIWTWQEWKTLGTQAQWHHCWVIQLHIECWHGLFNLFSQVVPVICLENKAIHYKKNRLLFSFLDLLWIRNTQKRP